VVKGLPAEWGTCLCTVSLNGSAQGLSYHNNTIALGSSGGDIIILNAITGSQTAVLSGHTFSVLSVAYSPDGVFLVSGGFDDTIKLWDMQTGGVVKTFYGHTDCVISVSVSADCTRIASGSRDYTIRLWNIQTGKYYCIINQEDSVNHISFSPTDPQHLLSICNGKVRQWDINGHQAGHAYGGSHVTFSSDGIQFALRHGQAVTVRNSSSGVIVTEFQTVNKFLRYCCFSPDGRLIAVTSGYTAYVWDITSSTPNLIETFTSEITSLVFSSPSSLISASVDGSIKFWKIGSSSKDPLKAPKSTLPTSANIGSITLQAKDGIIITSDSDGVVKTWDILTGLCKASFQTPAKGNCARDAQLINGKLIFCWFASKIDPWDSEKIKIWDAEKGKLLLEMYAGGCNDFRISEDGSRVFCLAGNSIQAWSIQTGESMGMVEAGSECFRPLTVDNSRVWVRSWFTKLTVMGWDFGTPGSSPVQLPETPPYKLHPNGIMLWDTGLHRIKDTIAGKVVFQLPRRYGKPEDVQWNGHYLVACFSTTKVLILDFSHILK